MDTQAVIEESAKVVAVDEERVWVAARRESACGRCALRSGCGHGLLDAASSQRMVHIGLEREAANFLPEVGDEVLLGISEHAVLRASLFMYGVPLLGFIGGAVVATLVGANDPAAFASSLAGLVMGLGVAAKLEDSVEVPTLLERPAGAEVQDV